MAVCQFSLRRAREEPGTRETATLPKIIILIQNYPLLYLGYFKIERGFSVILITPMPILPRKGVCCAYGPLVISIDLGRETKGVLYCDRRIGYFDLYVEEERRRSFSSGNDSMHHHAKPSRGGARRRRPIHCTVTHSPGLSRHAGKSRHP